MVKFIALYKQPADRAAFDAHFDGVHAPLCHLVPNLMKMEVTRFTGTPRGESDLYLMAEMYFESQALMMEGLMSDAGKATAKDARAFAGDIFSGYFGAVATPVPAGA
ncbi:MAG: EthD family reductase [Candidatus Sericytochromatia bacterium]|nr:EthD family reductase [Candidatus Sericytochromatia bacterium]